MTRTQIKALFMFLLREVSTNTSISDTDQNTIIDLAYQKVVEDTMPEILSTSQIITVPRTTLASRISAVSITVTSAASFSANTDLVIHSGSRFDPVRVNTINGVTFTLDSPGLVYTSHATGASGAVVVPVSFIINDSREFIGVSWLNPTTTDYEWSELKPSRQIDMFRKGQLVESTGDPKHYALKLPTELKVWPVPESSGYLEIRYKNKTSYTLATDGASPVIDADDQFAMVVYCLALVALRNRDWDGWEKLMNLYEYLIAKARNNIVRKKEDNAKWGEFKMDSYG